MMYLDALESAKVELSLISKCNEKEEEEEEKQLALQPRRVGHGKGGTTERDVFRKNSEWKKKSVEIS